MKNLKGELFQVDVDASDQVRKSEWMLILLYRTLLCILKVSVLKGKIQAARSELAADRQKLIHSGKVLKDEQTVAELGLSESDFLVCMLSKEVAKVNTSYSRMMISIN